ncbi:MAG: hypothetical protein AAGG01_05070 [Planctomycetota bacterium]
MELQESLPDFSARGVAVVAISQEDPDLERAPGILDGLDATPTYPVLIDIDRRSTSRLARTTAYLVDRHGKVVQVFPMMTHMRATVRTLLGETNRIDEPLSW